MIFSRLCIGSGYFFLNAHDLIIKSWAFFICHELGIDPFSVCCKDFLFFQNTKSAKSVCGNRSIALLWQTTCY